MFEHPISDALLMLLEQEETIRRLTTELEELTQATDALTSRLASIQPGTAGGTGQKIIDGLHDAIAGRYDRVTVYHRDPARPRSERSWEVTEEMLAAARAAFDEHARHVDMQDGLIDDPLGYALGAAIEAALSNPARPTAAGEYWAGKLGEALSPEPWRLGRHYPIHVYQGDRPVATFFREEDAAACVAARNTPPASEKT